MTLDDAITISGLAFVITNSVALGLRVHVGEVLVHFIKNWKLAVWVALINFLILPALIIGFAALVSIPDDVKIGYCIVALAAGAPFAPAITRLAKGNVEMSSTLFLLIVALTAVVAPIALPPTVSAVVPGVNDVSIWDVAWPLLTLMIAPIAVGCLMRLQWDEAVTRFARPLVIISIVFLLLYTNFFIYSTWDLFVSSSGTGAYIAAVAVPILGIALGSIISIKDPETRHACAITTAQRSISGAIILTVFNYTQPLANVSVTIINTFGILILLVLSLGWRHEEKGSLAPPSGVRMERSHE